MTKTQNDWPAFDFQHGDIVRLKSFGRLPTMFCEKPDDRFRYVRRRSRYFGVIESLGGDLQAVIDLDLLQLVFRARPEPEPEPEPEPVKLGRWERVKAWLWWAFDV